MLMRTGWSGRISLDGQSVIETWYIGRSKNHRGYVPIETLSINGMPYDPFQVVPAFTERVKAAMAQSGGTP